ILAREALEALGFEADGCGRTAEIVGGPIVEIDPEEPVVADPDVVPVEIDLAILRLRVVQDGADRHRIKARTPAAIAAISARDHSTTRIERSSTSVSAAATVVWWIIDSTPVCSPSSRLLSWPTRAACWSGARRCRQDHIAPMPRASVLGAGSYHRRCTVNRARPSVGTALGPMRHGCKLVAPVVCDSAAPRALN